MKNALLILSVSFMTTAVGGAVEILGFQAIPRAWALVGLNVVLSVICTILYTWVYDSG